MIKPIQKKLNCIFGLASFVLYALSFLIGYDEMSANHLFLPVKMGLITVSAVLYYFSCSCDFGPKIKTHYVLLTAVILVYHILLLISVGRTVFYIRDYSAILNSISWITCCLAVLFKHKRVLTGYIKSTLINPITLKLITSSSLVALFVILLSIEPSGIMFTWDSDTLYEFIYRQGFQSLYDAKLLTFHSHVSIVYAHILVLFKLLFGNIRIAFFLLNTLCIVTASFGMTFLLQYIFPEEGVITYTLANSVFMFSPWICGLSTYHIYDYYIWSLFPLLILYLLRNNWIGFFITGVLISFSKATGLVVFGSVCFAILSIRCINDHRQKRNIISFIFDIKYWYFLSVAVIFYVFFKSGIAEVTQFEDVRFGISVPHILQQLKIYFTSNFLWIYTILLLVLLVFMIKKDSRITGNTRMIISILLISDTVFFIFNCLCITYRLPRYMDSHIPIMYLLASVTIINLINRHRIAYIAMSVLSVLSLVSSFRTLDPVSSLLFNTINVGDHRIIDFEMSTKPSLGDSVIYNREYYSYEVLLDKTLRFVTDNKKPEDEILFSLGEDINTWGKTGGRYSYTYDDNKRQFELYYDRTIPGLANGYSYEYHDYETMIPLIIRCIFNEESASDVVSSSTADRFYYIYMPTINNNKENTIYNDYMIISEETFTFRGWNMNCIVFEKY